MEFKVGTIVRDLFPGVVLKDKRIQDGIFSVLQLRWRDLVGPHAVDFFVETIDGLGGGAALGADKQGRQSRMIEQRADIAGHRVSQAGFGTQVYEQSR